MSQKDDDKETPLWLTLLKLVVVLIVLIGGVGFALVWVDEEQSKQPSPAEKPADPWGIVKDSPIHPRR
jgi:flagellar basal body-associated protein FliL